MKPHSLALADPAILNWLERCLPEGMPLAAVSGEVLKSGTEMKTAKLVFIQVEGAQRDERLSLLGELAAGNPGTSVVAVAEHADSGTILACMRAGAADFLLVGQDDSRFTELLSGAARRGGNERRVQSSNVIAVFGGHADSGLAFLAQHLVLAISDLQRKSEAALLLDLASPPGAAGVFMNVQTEYSALDAVDDAYRCDATLVDTAFGQHRDGTYVLSLPETLAGAPSLEVSALRMFLDVAVTMFAQIVICADRCLGEPVLHSIAEYANHSLVLCDQSILSSRHSQQMLRGMRGAGVDTDNAGLVVDRYQKRIGLEPDKLAGLLQLPLYGVLAGDPVNRVKAMNAGESLFETASGDEYLRGVKKLAEMILGRVSTGTEKRGFLEKLLS